MNIDHTFVLSQSNSQSVLIKKAIDLLPLSIGAETIAVLLVWSIFGRSVHYWYEIALFLMSLRALLYLFFSKGESKGLVFILSNFISMAIWASLSIFCMMTPQVDLIKIALVFVGISAGAITFLAYVRYLYIVYGFFTLGFFAFTLMLQGNVLLYIGAGLIILFIYLASLSFQYNELLKKYFDSYEVNSELIRMEQEQITKLRKINISIKQNMAQRAQIENKMLESNDLIHHSIQNILSLENETKRDLDFLIEKIEHGVLYIDKKSNSFRANRFFFEGWGIEERDSITLAELKTTIEQKIRKNPLFSLNFPYPVKNSVTPYIVQTLNDSILEAWVNVYEDDLNTVYLWAFKDISEEQTNQNILKLAMYDTLTMLPTRRVLYQKLEQYISSHKNTDQIFALVFMDINNFKMINDSLGHQAGNELLKLFAQRLKKSIGPKDFVGRMGGDEFICIFPNLTYKSDIEPIVKKIVDILQEKIEINDRSFILKSSIGVSFFPCDSVKADKLLSFADMAMYKAKEKKGTVLYQSYFPRFSIELANKHHMGQDLKTAIINNTFYLVYQPIYSIVDNDWVKVEVLLRWRDHVGPDVFIPLASEIGLMPEIGLWVLEQSCKVRLELAKISDKPIKFSINISAEQIQSSDDINLLIDVINKYKCPPEWLEFELTESLLFDMAKADNFIKKIKSLGISVAIDDFGTGYSSFSYLKNLHFDTIKIDKQFVNSIFSNPREMSLVLSIIEISHSLNAQITVEGVETKEHFDFCVHQGCHYVQGYYIAKPCDLSSLIDKLSTIPHA